MDFLDWRRDTQSNHVQFLCCNHGRGPHNLWPSIEAPCQAVSVIIGSHLPTRSAPMKEPCKQAVCLASRTLEWSNLPSRVLTMATTSQLRARLRHSCNQYQPIMVLRTGTSEPLLF